MRLLSIVVLAPAVLAVTWQGGWLYAIAVMAATALGLIEWLRLIDPRAKNYLIVASLASLAAILLPTAFGWVGNGFLLLIMLTVAIWWLAFNLNSDTSLRLRRFSRRGAQNAGLIALGLPYMAGTGLALIYLRGTPAGHAVIFYLLAAVWGTDSGAYIAGKCFGGPKLASSISPNKTWSGAVGGLVLGGVAAAAVVHLTNLHPPLTYVLLALFLSAAAQAGDLFKSFFKRRAGVKDSGHLIPGHGGMLDRIDGLAFAGVLFALYQALLG